MTRTRTTLTIEADVLRAVKLRAARTGQGDSEVIEEALRHALGLDVLEQMWSKATLDESEAQELAVDAQHQTRRRGRARG